MGVVLLDEMKGSVELLLEAWVLSADCVDCAVSGEGLSSDGRITTRSPVWKSTSAAGVGRCTTTSGVTADNSLGGIMGLEMAAAVGLGAGATAVTWVGCLEPPLGKALPSYDGGGENAGTDLVW